MPESAAAFNHLTLAFTPSYHATVRAMNVPSGFEIVFGAKSDGRATKRDSFAPNIPQFQRLFLLEDSPNLDVKKMKRYPKQLECSIQLCLMEEPHAASKLILAGDRPVSSVALRALLPRLTCQAPGNEALPRLFPGLSTFTLVCAEVYAVWSIRNLNSHADSCLLLPAYALHL